MLLRHQDRRLLAAMHRLQRFEQERGGLARLQVIRGKLGHMFWTVISGSDIAREAQISPKVAFPHLSGVVIHEDAVVEDGCMIMQQVTLGQRGKSGAPRVCRGAYIGAGAKVLGEITIGENARIGANAVVLVDVPAHCTAVGIPAQVFPQTPADPHGKQTSP